MARSAPPGSQLQQAAVCGCIHVQASPGAPPPASAVATHSARRQPSADPSSAAPPALAQPPQFQDHLHAWDGWAKEVRVVFCFCRRGQEEEPFFVVADRPRLPPGLRVVVGHACSPPSCWVVCPRHTRAHNTTSAASTHGAAWRLRSPLRRVGRQHVGARAGKKAVVFRSRTCLGARAGHPPAQQRSQPPTHFWLAALAPRRGCVRLWLCRACFNNRQDCCCTARGPPDRTLPDDGGVGRAHTHRWRPTMN